MIRPLSKTEAEGGAYADVFETPRKGGVTKVKCYPPSPLDSGTLDNSRDCNTLFSMDLRRGHPLSKVLDSGSVDESHKPNSWNKLRQSYPVSKLGHRMPMNGETTEHKGDGD